MLVRYTVHGIQYKSTHRHAILLHRVRLVVFAIRWDTREALEAHVHIEALETPVPEANYS